MHIELVNVVDLVGRQRFMNINWQNLLFRIRYKLSAVYHCTDIQLVNISGLYILRVGLHITDKLVGNGVTV